MRFIFSRLIPTSALLIVLTLPAAAQPPIRVLIWDEQQPEQQQAYGGFLGDAIADHLRTRPGLLVTSVRQDGADKGISRTRLEQTDVVIWWGHRRQSEVTVEDVAFLLQRVEEGKLALIALHSAHWSTPFIEAMNRVTLQRALNGLPSEERAGALVTTIPANLYKAPKRSDPLTPQVHYRKYPDQAARITIHQPLSCFPAVRADGKPSTVLTLRPEHPIAKDLPPRFAISETEMYDEPFHVPEPDLVIFEERWPTGEWFRSGSLWKLGRGSVFYFRPGHETYAVYRQALPLRVLENAVRYLTAGRRAEK